MPIYEKVRRGETVYQVVVCLRRARKDLIIRGTREDAEKAERGLLATMQRDVPRRVPAWRKVAGRARDCSSDTHVYFIQAGANGPIKIGRAASAEQRLQNLQLANHEELRLLFSFRAPRLVETELHDRFQKARIRGEWFRPVPELLRTIDALSRRRAR